MAISPSSPSLVSFQEDLDKSIGLGKKAWKRVREGKVVDFSADELLPLQNALVRATEKRRIRYDGANHPQARGLTDQAAKQCGL